MVRSLAVALFVAAGCTDGRPLPAPVEDGGQSMRDAGIPCAPGGVARCLLPTEMRIDELDLRSAQILCDWMRRQFGDGVVCAGSRTTVQVLSSCEVDFLRWAEPSCAVTVCEMEECALDRLADPCTERPPSCDGIYACAEN
jgi:hypothetical protein